MDGLGHISLNFSDNPPASASRESAKPPAVDALGQPLSWQSNRDEDFDPANPPKIPWPLDDLGELPEEQAPPDTKTELLDVMQSCIESTEVMAKTFFADHCYRPFCSLHDEIFSILDDDSIRAAAICCPRGFGKTTLLGLVFPAKKILFQEVHYVLLISATASKAIKDLKTLSSELLTNDRIKKVFGGVQGKQWAEGSGELELSTGIKIEAKGAGAQIRGLKYKQYRPDLILIDDLENAEGVRNEERRKQLKEWLFADVMNSIDLRKTRVVLLGTLLHEDSILANLIDENAAPPDEFDDEAMAEAAAREKFKTVRLEACDDQYETTWPDYISTAEIKAKAAAYEKRGMLDVFYREYRNLPIAAEGAAFTAAYFKRYQEDFKELNRLDNVVIIDPAKTTNISSNPSAIVGIGFDSVKNRIYFRDCIKRKLHPEEIYQLACEMADRIGTCNIGIEVTSLNEFVTYPFQTYLKTKTKYYNLVELKARGKKEERIAALVPFYRIGAIYHNVNLAIRGPLETQLVSFPRSKEDDVMDAFAYMIKMFDIGERFFSTEPEDIEDEYKELEDLPPMDEMEGWRNAP